MCAGPIKPETRYLLHVAVQPIHNGIEGLISGGLVKYLVLLALPVDAVVELSLKNSRYVVGGGR